MRRLLPWILSVGVIWAVDSASGAEANLPVEIELALAAVEPASAPDKTWGPPITVAPAAAAETWRNLRRDEESRCMFLR